jgi:hypothetical protein
MSALAWHVTMRLVDDRVLAQTDAARRRLARAVFAAFAGASLLAFRGADTHLHVIAQADRARVGEAARRAALRLRYALHLPIGFEAARIRPVADQRHLENAVRYVLRQEQHHGTDSDPYHDAGALPEALGMRLLDPALAGRLTSALPRLTRAALLESVAWHPDDTVELTPADAGLATEAAAAALGAEGAVGNGRDAAAVRALALALSDERAVIDAIAARLRIGARALRALRARAPGKERVTAARRQASARCGGAQPPPSR